MYLNKRLATRNVESIWFHPYAPTHPLLIAILNVKELKKNKNERFGLDLVLNWEIGMEA